MSSCSSPLKVTQLTCLSCGTGVVGSFELSPFLRLSDNSLHFLTVFVRNCGNIKEMARETGKLGIHNIGPRFIREAREKAGEDICLEEILEMRVNSYHTIRNIQFSSDEG